jgi:HK97 family phage portal protein
MIGTTQPNFIDRLAMAFGRTTKAAPKPAELYPMSNQGAVGALPLSWPGWEDYEKHYANDQSVDLARAKVAVTSPWVFSDITAIANEASVAVLQMTERDASDEGETDIENHPLELVWETPNAFMGRSFLVSFWIWQRILSGKAYLFWVPDTAGEIAEVWPVPTWMMTPHAHETKFIDGYVFKASPSSKPMFIEAKYITYSRIPHPFDIRDGLSPLAAIYTEIEADLAMSRWNKTFFSKENAAPSGIITVPVDTLDNDLQRVRVEVQDFFSTASGRRVGVARAGDMNWVPFDRSQKDMEFLLGRKFEGALIDRVLGFPEGFWAKDATRANSEGAKATMIENAVWPHLVALAEDINAQTIPHWFGTEYRATFDDIRPRNRTSELAEFSAYQAVKTVDELRALIGDKPIGDVRGLMLISELNKGTPTPTSEPAMEMEATLQAQADEAAEDEPEALPDAAIDDTAEDTAATPLDVEAGPAVDEEVMKSSAIALLAHAGTAPTIDDTDDLARWERKALKGLKRFRNPAQPFVSASIDAATHARISGALKVAQTAEEVKAAFSVDALLDSVDAEARMWVEEAEGDE